MGLETCQRASRRGDGGALWIGQDREGRGISLFVPPARKPARVRVLYLSYEVARALSEDEDTLDDPGMDEDGVEVVLSCLDASEDDYDGVEEKKEESEGFADSKIKQPVHVVLYRDNCPQDEAQL